MKKVIVLLTIGAIIAAGCKKDTLTGTGSVATETRTVGAFDKVSTSGATKVTINQGADFSIQVKAYGNLLPHLKTTVTNGLLEIAFDKKNAIENDNSEVLITMPALTRITTKGSGNVNAMGNFVGNEQFYIGVSGSADVAVQSGTAQSFISKIEGSGNIKAFGLTAEEADVTITGSGNTEISANQRLNAKIEGSGSVYYKGSPVVTTTITGSGKIIKQ